MPSELGEYLRTRRARITPATAGLPSTGLRRVPGLRREEVALLSGVSVDYYVRLEQGRERRPSAQVLDALALSLALTDDEYAHLFALAGAAPRARRTTAPDRVDPALRQLLCGWSDNPALVYNQATDILATNEIADALFGHWPFSATSSRSCSAIRPHRAFTSTGRKSQRTPSPDCACTTARTRVTHGSAPS